MALRKFCCCELKNGVFYITVLNIVLQIMFCLLAASSYSKVSAHREVNDKEARNFFANFAGYIAAIIVNFLMLNGIMKEKRGFFLPFLILAAIGNVILDFMVITYFCMFPSLWYIFLLISVFLCFNWYYWYAVLSLYRLWNPNNLNSELSSSATEEPVLRV